MVAVPSTMQALGSPAHDFELPNVSAGSELVSLPSDKPVLLLFICNHCPYVIHILDQMVSLANQAQAAGYFVVAISANDAEAYPQDGPKAMKVFAKERGFEFPYLFDESQSVAKKYGAACTPDFYVYDKNHRLQYRGQMDGARPSNSLEVTGKDLQAALDDVLAGRATNEDQTPSIGCNIKWRAGNEPDYF